MQYFDEFFFHSRQASKSDTLNHLRLAIQAEYLSDLSSSKFSKPSPPQNFTFTNLSAWLYQKTHNSVSPDAKKLWAILFQQGNETSDELKFEDFFRVYSEALYEKHQKSMGMRRKAQKISKLKRRATKYQEGLDNLLRDFGHKPTQNRNNLIDLGGKCSFLISLDTLEIGNIFKDQDYLGHHVELGYKEAVVFTQSEQTNGRLVNFRKTQLTLNLDYMTGTIFLNVYEDFLRENRIDKTLVARRNLDLFSNLSRSFILKLLIKDIRDEALTKKFLTIFDEMALEDDNEEGPSRDNNLRLLKGEGKMNILEDARHHNVSISNNYSHDLIENELRTERFKLCKTNNPVHNPYVFLRLYISCDNLKGIDDLGYYSELMEKRREFLAQKAEKVLKKMHFYKSVLSLLTVPVRGVVVTDSEIRVDRKFLKLSGHSLNNETMTFAQNRRSCNIF